VTSCRPPTGDGPLAQELERLYHCLHECKDGCRDVDDRWIAAVERRLEERFGPDVVRDGWRDLLERRGAA
jgi:hypothetical protein